MTNNVMVETEPRQRRLSPRASEILAQHCGTLPIWIRPPKVGLDFHTGLSRPKLYQLAAEGHIRSVSIREPGQVKGTRLFDLQSILNYFDRLAAQQTPEAA